MNKQDAINLLGGTPEKAAEEIGITGTAVRLWPDPLPSRIRDRVQAALWRRLMNTSKKATRRAA
jgi:hypothetical protein